MRRPAIFFGHGSPMNALGGPFADVWRAVGEAVGKPRGVVMISAHWETEGLSVTAQDWPRTIHDFGGFPAELPAMQYPAPGSPDLAARVSDLTGAVQTQDWGLDHGSWSVLAHVWPDADVPVVQLSLRHDLDPQAHLQAGQALTTLRDEGVLIVGSGMSFHNMRGYGDPRFGPISDTFDAWLTATVEADPATRAQGLAHWDQAPSARLCHPPRAEEHLLPLMVVAGAASEGRGQRVFSDRVLETTLSAYRFD